MGASASAFPVSFRCTRLNLKWGPCEAPHLISEGAKVETRRGEDELQVRSGSVSAGAGVGRMLRHYRGPRCVLR